MSSNFEQISLKPGFMKHNGGLLFRNISETEYEFKSVVDLRTNLDVMPIYQMNFEHIGMTAPCSIAAIIYNMLIQKGPQFHV